MALKITTERIVSQMLYLSCRRQNLRNNKKNKEQWKRVQIGVQASVVRRQKIVKKPMSRNKMGKQFT
jgi:hypothetical protein